MQIIKCIHTNSDCYKKHKKANPVGIVVHSTGVNQTKVGRYCQPSPNDSNYNELIAQIGKNKKGNHWNRSVDKAVHYMIGKIADGSVATIQTLPEDICCWGVGKGKKGSYNYNPTAHIQFEVCEDNLKDEAYFTKVYTEAVELCADICKRYGWKSDVIVSHQEAYKKGYASNHKDIDHWLKKFGKTMDDFRDDVAKQLEIKTIVETPNLNLLDEVKIRDGVTTFANGATMRTWVRSARLYVRGFSGTNRVKVSTLKEGTITGTVFATDLVLVRAATTNSTDEVVQPEIADKQDEPIRYIDDGSIDIIKDPELTVMALLKQIFKAIAGLFSKK